MAFTKQCTAEHLFDFIEASFKLDVSSRMFGEENQFVAALDDISRRDGAPFQVLPGITREEPGPRYVSIIRMAFPRVVRVDEEAAHTEAVLPDGRLSSSPPGVCRAARANPQQTAARGEPDHRESRHYALMLRGAGSSAVL